MEGGVAGIVGGVDAGAQGEGRRDRRGSVRRSSGAGIAEPRAADSTGLYDEKSRRSRMNALPPPRL